MIGRDDVKSITSPCADCWAWKWLCVLPHTKHTLTSCGWALVVVGHKRSVARRDVCLVADSAVAWELWER